MKCYIRHSISDIPMFEITEKSPVGIICLTFKTYRMRKLLLFVSLMLLIPLCVSAQEASGSDRVVVWEEDFSGFSKYEKNGGDGVIFDYNPSHDSENGSYISFSECAAGHSPEARIIKGKSFSVTIPSIGVYGQFQLTFKAENRKGIIVTYGVGKNPPALTSNKGVYTVDVKPSEKIVLTFKNSESVSSIDDIVLTAPAECWKDCDSPDLKYSVDTCSYYLGDTYSLPRLSNPHNLAVSYWSTDASVAEVSGKGEVKVKGIGSTKIIAICHSLKKNADGTIVPDRYSYQKVSYVLNIKRRPLANEVFYESFDSNLLDGSPSGGTSIKYFGLSSTEIKAKYDIAPNFSSNVIGAERAVYIDINGSYKIGPFKNLGGKNCHLSLRVGSSNKVRAKKGSSSSAKVTVQDAASNTIKENKLTVSDGAWTPVTLDLGDIGDEAYITISGSEFFLDDVSLIADGSGVGVEIGEHKYATLYYSDTPLMVPESMTAFTLKFSGNNLVASRIYSTNDIIPKGEAVVLYATSGQYTFPVCSSSLGRDADNLLRGSDDDGLTTGGDIYYFFGVNKSGDVGFYLGKADGSAFTNKAHKAYLPLTKSESGAGTATSKAFLLSGLPFTTAIGKIHYDGGSLTEAPAYNLAGQRVGKDYKGIVIINGRKVLRK